MVTIRVIYRHWLIQGSERIRFLRKLIGLLLIILVKLPNSQGQVATMQYNIAL
jgi:hypothetical protein